MQKDDVFLESKLVHLYPKDTRPDLPRLVFLNYNFLHMGVVVDSCKVKPAYFSILNQMCVDVAAQFGSVYLAYDLQMDDTLKALEIGVVDILIVWENLDINRYKLKNVTTGEVLSYGCLCLLYGVAMPWADFQRTDYSMLTALSNFNHPLF
ncbi:eukaryotic peptide chain release factor subunit 1-3 [Tanacetum coccineum]